MCTIENNQDNQCKLRLYDETKMFLRIFLSAKRENNNRNILVYKSNKTAYIGFSLKKDNIEKSEQVLLPGHSLSVLQRLYSGLLSQSVIMVDTGHVPGFCRLGRIGPRRAHA